MNSLAQSVLDYRLDYALLVVVIVGLYGFAVGNLLQNGRFHRAMIACGIAIVFLLVAGIWFTERAAIHAREVLVNQIQGIVPVYALELSRNGHENVTRTTPHGDPTYLKLIEVQKQWLKVNPAVADIYTFRPNESNVLEFMVDSETDYDGNQRFEGDREKRTPIAEAWKGGFQWEPIRRAMAGSTIAMDDVFFRDRWGVWVSAYSPIRDSTGKVDALVGVDFPVDSWITAIQSARLSVISRIGLLAVMILAASSVIAALRNSLAIESLVHSQLAGANERAEQAANEARQAELVKTNFLSNMSHEIRTPMNGVIGMTQLLGQTNLDPEQLHYQSLALDSAQTLMGLLNNVLDYTKIESGKLELESVPFDIDELTIVCLQCVGKKASDNGIELILNIDPAVPQRLGGDPTRLKQVLMNLVGNASKFTDKGEIEVAVSCDNPKMPEKSDSIKSGKINVQFSVRDTGVGIAPENHQRIFELFSQEDNSTTRHRGGTGLGLAICRQLVSRMGGQLELESEKGKGARFFFSVELEIESLVSKRPTYEKESAVLLIENAVTRTLCRQLLQSLSITTQEVQMGTSMPIGHGINPATMIIVDSLRNPSSSDEICGIKLAQQIAASWPDRQVKILVLAPLYQPTGVTDIDFGTPIKTLFKPFSRTQFLEEVCLLVDEKKNSKRRTSGPIGFEKAKRIRRILLAEDNPINQQVAVSLLRKRGHQVDVVGDGLAAVQRVLSQEFDIVLMDVQMPKMNGLDAARQIRIQQGSSRRIPIYAITAQAMPGDENECLESGMDGYISKPFDPKRLFEIVESVDGHDSNLTIQMPLDDSTILSQKRAEMPSVPQKANENPITNEQTRLVFDPRMLAQLTGGSTAAEAEMITLFESESVRQYKDIEVAVGQRDGKHLASAAHALKGSASIFGAQQCRDTLIELEQCGRKNDFEIAKEKLQVLQQDLDRLCDVLKRHHDHGDGVTNEEKYSP
jgi:signal transduction histidine kinase/CheY-like chemotaxis protein